MANLTVQSIDLAGLENPSAAAATGGGDTFPNDGRTIFRALNGSGAPIVITFNSLALSDFGTDEDIVVSVAAGADAFIGPFDKARFNDGTGLVGVSYSGVTSLTVAAISLDERGF